MPQIEIISSSLIKTTSNATPISRLELTQWDLQLLLLDPIQKGLLFHQPESEHLRRNIIDHLKSSLSRTLDFFPPLAGRLATVQHDDGSRSFSVDCNNAGVEFVHAVAGAVSISDILEPIYIPEIVSSFFLLNGVANFEGVSKPLMAVQVTELADGLFIACAANHAVVDGNSFWHLFNSWSEISRGSDSISKSPVFDRGSQTDRNQQIRLPPLELSQFQSFASPPLLERVFHFSKESLAKLKMKANSEAGTNRISSLQAISAHLWLWAARCRRSSLNLDTQEAGFTMVVGARARLPLPDAYFGNAVYAAKMAVGEAELLQKGFDYAAMKINELVAQQTNEIVVKFMDDWVKTPNLLQKGSYGLSFSITSSPRHNVYGNDFGWGKPIAVRSGKGQKFDGKVTIFPAAEAGGIDAEVCLAPETLRAMEDDTEFMTALFS